MKKSRMLNTYVNYAGIKIVLAINWIPNPKIRINSEVTPLHVILRKRLYMKRKTFDAGIHIHNKRT